MVYEKGLFIFHRDFRIQDNIGLIEASSLCKELYLCFIFTPDQVSKINDFRSQNAIQFMIESLEDLSSEIEKINGQLLTFYGKQTKVIKTLKNTLNIDSVFFNKDYTPYAMNRSKETMDFCKRNNLLCKSYSDYYLYEPGSIVAGGGDVYKKFTPFYDSVLNNNVEKPNKNTIHNIAAKVSIEHLFPLDKALALFVKQNKQILVHGGRNHGLKRLTASLPEQKKYDETRDFFINKTSFLSAYIKFGCVSIREVYHAYKERYSIKHGLIRELIWREFFAHVLYRYPRVMGESFQEKFKRIKWRTSGVDLDKWKSGETGFPLVDASMRQLNTSGYMHNRGRMMVATFLIKTLLIDWREGEKYFAQKLTDYDIASNNGNWQGISGTGVDMKPYFRDMNPWIQSAKFDKEAEFIKKWLPELETVTANDIHAWDTKHSDPAYKDVKYPGPIVNYYEQKEKMMAMYKLALRT
jgi:deoxyribodipyrimidine photo-lyase